MARVTTISIARDKAIKAFGNVVTSIPGDAGEIDIAELRILLKSALSSVAYLVRTSVDTASDSVHGADLDGTKIANALMDFIDDEVLAPLEAVRRLAVRNAAEGESRPSAQSRFYALAAE
jgi:hypothetical protein